MRLKFYVFIIIGFSIFAFSNLSIAGSTVQFKQYERALTIQSQDGTLHNFSIELAQTKKEQERGLMGRWNLDINAGMLFLFKRDRKRTFWMRNTHIPLDIIFIEGNGRIQHIHHMAKPQDDSFITSGKPARAVLEINGGLADQLGIKEDDIIYHSFFKNLNLLDSSQ